MNKEQKFNRQFQSRKNNGEHRNGRLSQYKNDNSQGADKPNEYVSKKEQ